MKLDGFAVTPVRSVSQFSYMPVYELVDGPHTVEASAHDRAGNPSALVASFHVDSQAPTGALLTSPGADQVVSGAITLAGTAMDTGSGVAHLSFLRDGLWIAEGSAANGFQAAWNSAATSDGAHLITAQPVDIAGNSGLASPAVRVIVNNQPLAVSFGSPAPGFPVKDQVAVAASPSEPVARVEFRAGSGPVVVDGAAPYEAVLDVSAEPEGELELTLIAVGLAPETATAARMVLVDRTSPAAPVNVQAESSGDSSVLVAGLAGSVELGALVEVENLARPARNERLAFADGSFTLRLAGEPGDEVRVVAIDVAGNRGEALVLEVETADAAESVPQDGLALWARAGRGVVVDGAGRVSRWADASASANDLVQTSPGQRPSRVTDPLSGRSVLRFDGTDDLLQFTARLAGSIRTVFAVVREDETAVPGSRALFGDASTADFYGGWQAWWVYQPPYVSTSQHIVDGQTWVNGVGVNGRTTTRPHTLSVVCVEATAGVTASRLAGGIYSAHWKGEIAELIVYERPLSIAERKAVEDYLALEYVPYQATAGAPRFAPNGGTFEDSVSVELASATPGAHVRYTTDGSMPTESSPLYVGPFQLTSTATVRARAYRPGMKPSAVSAVSFDKEADFSPGKVPDLALWVRGDIGLETDTAGRLTAWRDRSGRGNDLVQVTPSQQPLVVPAAANGLPAVRFDGIDDELPFTTRLDATIRTVFAVVWEDEDAAVLGRTLLGDATTADFYGGAPNWWSYSPPYVSTSAYIVNGQTWVNGVAVNGRFTPRPKLPSVLCVEATAGVTASLLGGGFVSNRWQGHVAELVVYDRPLSAFERKSVEDYLALRYVTYQPTAGAPAFTPNGGTFDDSVTVALEHAERRRERALHDGRQRPARVVPDLRDAARAHPDDHHPGARVSPGHARQSCDARDLHQPGRLLPAKRAGPGAVGARRRRRREGRPRPGLGLARPVGPRESPRPADAGNAAARGTGRRQRAAGSALRRHRRRPVLHAAARRFASNAVRGRLGGPGRGRRQPRAARRRLDVRLLRRLAQLVGPLAAVCGDEPAHRGRPDLGERRGGERSDDTAPDDDVGAVRRGDGRGDGEPARRRRHLESAGRATWPSSWCTTGR